MLLYFHDVFKAFNEDVSKKEDKASPFHDKLYFKEQDAK
jgi:hypothetical protein